MAYRNLITQKKFSWGGTALAISFPAHGGVSIVGSTAGGVRLAGSEELAKVHALMLLEGTKRRTKKEIQIALDDMGASLSFAATGERLRFVGKVRAPHAPALLELIAEILTEPAFPQEELAILKKREEAALSMEAQDTRHQAMLALSRLLYPAGHPNHEDTTDESAAHLAALTKEMLEEFHARTVTANGFLCAIAGDLATQKTFALIDKTFAQLPRTKVALPSFTKAAPGGAEVVAVPIPQKSSIDYMTAIATGITGDHKDYAPLMLGLQVLGNRGGFTGRLMQIVREQEGLTYGVYSYPSGFAKKTDGFLMAWGTFAPELFPKGRASIRREIERIVADGITQEEARGHAELFAARARVQTSNSSTLAALAHDTVADGRELSYIDEFPKRVLGLTAAQVNKALKQYLVPQKLSESAAGPVDAKAFSS